MTTAEAIQNVTEPVVRPAKFQAAIDGLRELADFLERRPDALTYFGPGLELNNPVKDLATVARAGYGQLEKVITDGHYILRKHFGPLVHIDYYVAREKVCRKVLKERKIVPAQAEQTIVIPAKPERVEEVYEWECPESILKDDKTRPPIRQSNPTDPTDSAELTLDPAELLDSI